MRSLPEEVIAKLRDHAQSILSGLEIAFLASFILLLINTVFFDPPTGFTTKFLPNVNIEDRELTRLYAGALGLILGVRLLLAAQRFDRGSNLFWFVAVVGTISANVGVIVLVTSSIFAFSVLLVPLVLLAILEVWHLRTARPIGFFRAWLPSAYAACATLWFCAIMLSDHYFKIEAAVPSASLELIREDVNSMLEGRDPCFHPVANIILTPFGYLTYVRTYYDTTCGADGLVESLGVDAIARFLVINEWIGKSSASIEDVDVPQLLEAEQAIWALLEEHGEVTLETESGSIILRTAESLVPAEPTVEDPADTNTK